MYVLYSVYMYVERKMQCLGRGKRGEPVETAAKNVWASKNKYSWSFAYFSLKAPKVQCASLSNVFGEFLAPLTSIVNHVFLSSLFT